MKELKADYDEDVEECPEFNEDKFESDSSFDSQETKDKIDN